MSVVLIKHKDKMFLSLVQNRPSLTFASEANTSSAETYINVL
jgi:hypothetical protein